MRISVIEKLKDIRTVKSKGHLPRLSKDSIPNTKDYSKKATYTRKYTTDRKNKLPDIMKNKNNDKRIIRYRNFTINKDIVKIINSKN